MASVCAEVPIAAAVEEVGTVIAGGVDAGPAGERSSVAIVTSRASHSMNATVVPFSTMRASSSASQLVSLTQPWE